METDDREHRTLSMVGMDDGVAQNIVNSWGCWQHTQACASPVLCQQGCPSRGKWDHLSNQIRQTLARSLAKALGGVKIVKNNEWSIGYCCCECSRVIWRKPEWASDFGDPEGGGLDNMWHALGLMCY